MTESWVLLSPIQARLLRHYYATSSFLGFSLKAMQQQKQDLDQMPEGVNF